MVRTLPAALLSAAIAFSVGAAERNPRMALIIDDLGDRLPEGSHAVALPGNLTYSILPHTPYARRLALEAHEQGKEVMVHLPMESVEGRPLGPGGLTLHMTREDFGRTLLAALASVPHASGVNNHMGSLLTRHPGHMDWLMTILKAAGGLYFIDSVTTTKSVALQLAGEHRLNAGRRDVFLDNERDFAYISRQFDKALARAMRTGSAIAIGHPYPETVAALRLLLPRLAASGVDLVPISELLRFRNERRIEQWQASLFPSRTAVRNSKP